MADEAYRIGPAPPRESYLNIDAILDGGARERRAGDPSRLRLSLGERATFARAPARRRHHLHRPAARGDPADGLARSPPSALVRGAPACRPCPGYDGERPGPRTLRARGAQRSAIPLLIKAAAGGGGKGMRVVDDAGRACASALARRAREARAAFGDDAVYLEKLHRARRATSRSRCSADATARRCTWASASARSSAATRR